MEATSSVVRFEIEPQQNDMQQAAIVIPQNVVTTLLHEATRAQQQITQTHGFSRGQVPLTYIEHNFRSMLNDHVKEFLFKHVVHTYLYKNIRAQKLLIAGEPRLTNIHIEANSDAIFKFDLSLFSPIELQEWKFFPFKAPKRKKYKDLDRQVAQFIKEEKENLDRYMSETIALGDWVSFDIFLVNNDNIPLINDHKENLWLKIGDEEVDAPFRDIFLGKKIGETFCNNHRALQEYFSDQIDTRYNFCITIVNTVPHAYFCLEHFKKYFKLKTNKDIYQKLIEVFSYRNDLSQRRSMVEETLKLLLSKHRFTVPKQLVARQQQQVMHAIQQNPDYHVYRMQKDFNLRVQQLAEKQTKEALIIDQIAYHDNIVASHHDIKNYLNFTKRARTKEFLYFTPPVSKMRGQELPVSAEELIQACTREKTLNHVIYHLTQK